MHIAMIGQKGVPAREGGVEYAVESLACHLASLGHTVDIYCRSSYVVKYELRSLPPGVNRIISPGIGTKHLDALSHTFFATLQMVMKRPDLLHVHAIGPALFTPIPAWVGIPIVTTVHGLDWQREKWGMLARIGLRFAEKVMVRFSDALIVVSPALEEHYKSHYGMSSEFIPNGVPILPQPSATKLLLNRFGVFSKEYFLFVGRIVPEKGLHLALQAMHDIGMKIPFVIAGEASGDVSYLERLKRDAPSNAIFVGHADRESLSILYRNAKALLLPSAVEGMPLVLLEAMSVGCPVIASNIPEIESVGSKHVSYFMSGNSVSLKEALLEFLGNETSKKNMAEASIERVRSYSWDRIACQTEAVYRKILDKKASGVRGS